MPRSTHYTPPLSRFLVCALYHEAKTREIPMTQLANNLVETALKNSFGWKEAQEQMRLGERINDQTSQTR